jgi:hypothetical protein
VLVGAIAALLAIVPAARAIPIQGDPMGGAAEPFIGAPATPNPVAGLPIPRHPFMAPNGRSNIHDDAYQSDTYQQSGPLGINMSVDSTMLAHECASITFDSQGRLVAICVGVEAPILAIIDPQTLAVLAEMPAPIRNPNPGGTFTDFSGGGYFYLDNQDRAVFPTNTRHIFVVKETPGPGLAMEHDYDLTSAVPSGDAIISALPDWSGRIWFASKQGIVGTVDPASGAIQTFNTHEPIGNSFSVDQTGGVFMVTDKAMYRFDAAPDGTPVVSWRQVYANTGQLKPGQTEHGSGTTPTLIGRRWVAITDNADPMDVVVYLRRRSRRHRPIRKRLVCSVPVFDKGASDTDQSLIGAGRSLIVENNYGYSGPLAVNGGGVTSPGLERVDIRKPPRRHKHNHAHHRWTERAAATLKHHKRKKRRACVKVWHSNERAPSVVPKVSLAAGLVYTYTKPKRDDNIDAWYFTALDFRTGRTVFSRLAGTGLGFNNNYAPVTLGPDGTAYIGVLGGLVALRDQPQ